MIGKAVHKILKDKISALNDGGIYPVIMPQNANYSISSSTNYPAIVYHQFNEFTVSKDKNPNMLYTRLVLQVISNTYKSIEDISTKVRDVLDHYVDKSSAGLADVPGYNYKGNNHSFISNVDIAHIFYETEDDNYFEKLELFTRRIEYDVYYYDDVLKLNYDIKNVDGYTPTNPLILAYDFTQKELMRRSKATDFNVIDYESIVDSGSYPLNAPMFVFNKLGKTKCLKYNYINNSSSNPIVSEYLKAVSSSPAFCPTYTESAGVLPYLHFENNQSLECYLADEYPTTSFYMPYGAMMIFIYKPETTGDENYLSGDFTSNTDRNPIIISHKKIGSDITLKFNPNGNTFDGSSRERTLINSTDSTKYWGGEYHFFCLSLGGCKDYTGGSVNQAGWFEYFNSDYNPNLTTGQILKNNSITGNTDDMGGLGYTQFMFNRIGTRTTGESSAGFRMYEFLMFIPNQAQTHNINADTAPFQPTDIIYKKVKDYIFNKYESLK